MRLALFLTAGLVGLGLASASIAQETDHSAHHPQVERPPVTTPVAPPAPPTTPDAMPCKTMMDEMSGTEGKPAPGAAPMTGHAGMTSEERQKHCADMMDQMRKPDVDKTPKK